MDSEFLNSPNKLNRSSSLSELSKLSLGSPSKYNVLESSTTRANNIQEHFGNIPLIRHYSYEQIYDPRIGSSPIIRIKDTISVGNFQHQESPWSNKEKYNKTLSRALLPQVRMDELQNSSGDSSDIKYFGKLPNFDFRFVKDCAEKLDVTPMDVDKSAEGTAGKDEGSPTDDNKLRKRRRVKKEDDVQENRRKILKGPSETLDDLPKGFSKVKLFILFIFLPILTYASFLHEPELTIKENMMVLSHKFMGQRDKCDDVLNVNYMLKDLKDNLHGQNSVIDDLSKFLHVKTFKTLVFTGPTGVGKSYAIERIKKTFIWSKNIHTLTYPVTESAFKALKLSLSHCGNNLVVMDSLTNTSSEQIYDFVRHLQQFNYENKMKTLMVLVYNTQEISDDLKVLPYDASQDIMRGFKSEFQDALDVSLVQFNKLERGDVVSCVLSEAKDMRIEITRKQAEQIADDLPQMYGCKGARAKLNLLKHPNVDSTK